MSSPLWPGRGGPVIDYISAMPSRDYCEKKSRSVTILGSTGSIGTNTLKVIDEAKAFFKVEALGAGRNIKLLAAQANRYEPSHLAVQDDLGAARLRDLLKPGYAPHILWGEKGYAKIAALDGVDCVVSAQSGSAGLCGTISACLAAKVICLANKESLVIAGGLLRNICNATGAAILPVDSEHNALFQCLAGHGQNALALILTASGGPFRGRAFAESRNMKAADALRHPNWSMGAKITIDSATMMNKGLEVIEAMHLYGVPSDSIEILVHPQSIVHSLVRLADNSLLAQLAVPDMRLPIADCMFWPQLPAQPVHPLDLTTCGPLAFEKPALDDFPCLKLARQAACYRAAGPWLACEIGRAHV